MVRPSRRVSEIGSYAFAEVDKRVAALRKEGIEPIDFGVGDPLEPTPPFIRNTVKESVDTHASSGYPSYIGSQKYRTAVAEWMGRRFDVDLDPDRQITSSVGSKEIIFHAAEGFVDPGEIVLIPSPGYPPYVRGTRFAEGEAFFLPLTRENEFLPDLDSVPDDIAERARILWLNYPNSPSGKIAPLEFFERAIAWCKQRDILLFSDEAYSEIYFGDETPVTPLQLATDGVAVFQSLSKRSCMTGYRSGWVAGDAAIIDILKKVKTNIDSGTPNMVQDAAITALSDEDHVQAMRDGYREKRDVFCQALIESGLPDCTPEATFYVWQKVPDSMTSIEFAERLLAPEIACVCTPGSWISEPLADGSNPGDGYCRFALVPTLEEVRTAAERIAAIKWV